MICGRSGIVGCECLDDRDSVPLPFLPPDEEDDDEDDATEVAAEGPLS